MRIESHIESQIPATLQAELKSRVDREFGSAPIVREHVWAEPTWVFLGLVDEQLVSFLNIVDRQVLADGEPAHFFGLNNVITEPQNRGQGYSRQLNQAATEFMGNTDQNAYGFLFCADALIPFYTKLGWQPFEGEVTISQPAGDKVWPSNAMIYNIAGCRAWKTVHLCGLPW